jgi:fluoride exporter
MTHSLQVLLAVALGGALGASGRHLVSRAMVHLLGSGFPWGTLLVNVMGSILMGGLIELAALRLSLSIEMRAFLFVGILGGFTTFSTFALDAVSLYERGSLGPAFFYVLGSVTLAICGLFLGLAFMRWVLT